MAEPAPLQVAEALDDLVNQFADPLSFLRELVQNSLDAGSDEVEIIVDFEAGEGDDGVAVVRIDDWGEGMTREIIDKRLTRLFSSAKDGDMTKIGKFGIGFVSVFAIDPDAVCVDTSRDGENWRVLFDADRKFKLLRLKEPVDGTKVKILKAMKRADFVDFEKRARATMEYWCKHCRGEVRFEGDLISRPFGIEAGCQVERDDGFSHVVVGHAKGHESFYGLYNTGLTLIEGRDEYYEEVVFKASSPHLEHTLTRDNVIRDQGYERVMGAVDSLIHDELCREVYAQLDAELRRTLPSQTREFCYQAALWHAKNTPDLTGKVGKRAAFVTPRGEMITVARSRAAHREDLILVASTRSPLSDAAEAAELTVVLGPAEGAVPALAALLAPHGVRVQAASKAFALAVPARTEAETKRWAPLRTAARRLLDAWGASVSAVQLGHFDYPGSSIGDRIAITQQTLGELTPMDDVGEVGEGFLARSRVLAVNADHPTVKSLVRLAQKQPEVAAYILLKLFLLGHRLDEDVDGELAGATTKLRRESGR